MVLAAGCAAAAPVIIHLIMRTKPRHAVFPAMRFVRKTHQANINKLRLKHLILLAMRVAAILLIVMLIARMQITASGGAEAPSGVSAVAIVIDNSGSMSYTHRGRMLFSRAKRLAADLIDSLPDGSPVAVISTSDPAGVAGFVEHRKLAGRQIADVQATFSGTGLGPALTRAAGMLAKVPMPRRQLWIVTDMTAHSWRNAAPMTKAEDVEFTVLNCGGFEPVNVALGPPRIGAGGLGSASVPAGSEVIVEAQLQSIHSAGEVSVTVKLDGRATDRKMVQLSADAVAQVHLSVRPQRRGVLHGRIELDRSDPLAMDNVRFFTLLVGEPAEMLLVRDPTTVGRRDETGFLMANAVAPAGAGPGRWISRRTITADRLDAGLLTSPRIVLLADVASLAASQWRELEDFIRRGGRLWIVAGALMSPRAYNCPAAQRIMPVALEVLQELPAPVGWRDDDLSDPMLAPFRNKANPPLSQVRCRRRFAVRPGSPDRRVVLRYEDGEAAIVRRIVGEGVILFWNFSPTREFSNLAALRQFPILAGRAAQLLAAEGRAETMHTLGESVMIPIPASVGGAVIAVRRPGDETARPVMPDPNRWGVAILADRIGHWDVQFTAAGQRISGGFSVNADPAESDLTPADADKVKALFPPGRVVIASDLAQVGALRGAAAGPLDLAGPVLLILLVLLVGESFFANRFYRRAVQVVRIG